MRVAAPWQVLVGTIASGYVAYVALAILALLFASLNFAYANAFVLLAMMAVFVFSIPANLNYTRKSHAILIPWLICHMLFCILIYAWHFSVSGIRSADGELSYSFTDALYFSATTWTTVGYGDFVAIRSMRLVTSLEAITGALFMPIMTALLWFMIEESTTPFATAYLDRKRYRFSASGDIVEDQERIDLGNKGP